jgi:hypothetical protein
VPSSRRPRRSGCGASSTRRRWSPNPNPNPSPTPRPYPSPIPSPNLSPNAAEVEP